MSAAPESDQSKFTKKVKSCWSCRVLSGGGLIVAGAYVLFHTRKLAQRVGPTMGAVAQLTFAVGVATWGLVILTDPTGQSNRKT